MAEKKTPEAKAPKQEVKAKPELTRQEQAAQEAAGTKTNNDQAAFIKRLRKE